MTTPRPPADLEALDRSISRAHILVTGAMITAFSLYLIWFWVIQKQPVSDSSASWGVFGDFVGGLLNPVVAYAAFYWLTRSVRLQKEELSETRRALVEATEAQVTQAEHARSSVRLSALSALANSITAEVQIQRLHVQFLVDQLAQSPAQRGARTLDGTWLNLDPLMEHLATINRQIGERMTERHAFEQEIRSILENHR